MKVRAYGEGDRGGCLSVFDSNVPGEFRPGERGEYEAFLDALPGAYLVVEDEGGRVVACGGYALEPDGQSVAMCWGMVERGRQGEGLGRLLLEERIRRVRRNPAVQRVVLRTSHRARGFFEKSGFRAVRVTGDGIAAGLDAVDMILPL
jgi:GNAT superfamily N-acetyltransferase